MFANSKLFEVVYTGASLDAANYVGLQGADLEAEVLS